jgi:hypothetical protein
MTKIGGSSANSYTSQAKTENNTTQLLDQHTQKIGKVIIVGDKISTACELSERLGRIMVAASEGQVDIVVSDKAKLKPVNSDAVLTHYHPERTD